MAKETFPCRLDPDQLEELRTKAAQMGISPSALSRIYIRNGLAGYTPAEIELRERLDSVSSLITSVLNIAAANLFLTSRGQAINVKKVPDTEKAQIEADATSELIRLLKISLGNAKPLLNKIEAGEFGGDHAASN